MVDRKNIHIKWVHTSDVHANLFGCDYQNGMRYVGGGLSDVYSYICDLKKEDKDHFIVTDGGDCLQGQPLAYYYNFVDTKSPHLVAEVMNEMGYVCGVIGNHDIETGEKTFERWRHDCKFPILGANVIDKRTGKPYLKPYVVVERSGVKIVILGLVTPAMPYYQPSSLWPHLQFEEMLPCAKQWIERIQKEEQPDLLVELFHGGFEGGIEIENICHENEVRRIAEQVPGFDLILYGHDHVPAMHRVKNIRQEEVFCISALSMDGCFAEVNIDITYDKGKIISKAIDGHLVYTNQIPNIGVLIKKYEAKAQQVEKWAEQPLCRLEETLDERDSYFGSARFMNYIHQVQFCMTNAEISLAAPYSYNTVLKQGELRIGDLFSLLPYEEFVYSVRLSGSEIKKALEYSYDMWIHTVHKPDERLLQIHNSSANISVYKRFKRLIKRVLLRIQIPNWQFDNYVGRLCSAAGITYTVDVTQPYGERIKIQSMVNGTPYTEDKEYIVAINRRLLFDKDGAIVTGIGFNAEDISKRIISNSEKALPYYWMRQIQNHGIVKPKSLCQWRFAPEEIVSNSISKERKLLFPHK